MGTRTPWMAGGFGVLVSILVVAPTRGEAVAPRLERVAALPNPMPTGVTVSRQGRAFLCFPRWGDPVAATVMEYRDGRAVAYPDASWAGEQGDVERRLVSVQSVVVDARDHLWALDTGLAYGRAVAGGARLLGIDLARDAVVKVVRFPPEVMVPGTYLNDVRFDLARGAEGTAYVTDSSSTGPNGLLVVDLATGTVRRRLAGHRSVRPDPDFLPVVEGRPLRHLLADGGSAPLRVGADGIALSPDSKTLYYCPLSARRLYAVATDLLADPAVGEEQLAAAVRDLGEKPASDGLETGPDGTLYATAYEHDAIWQRQAGGVWEALVSDPQLSWPDTLAVGPGGWLWVVANQLHRQAPFRGGTDERRPPYLLLRVKLGAR